MTEHDAWGQGEYEQFAPTLMEPARHLVRLAAARPGERVIDLGAGTGNAALLLAEQGADVAAVDPSLRLLGIAETRAVARGLSLRTVVGRAESMPLPDGDADLIVSNFGMVFADEPQAALAETLRVLAPGGRLIYSAWLPTGPIHEVGLLFRSALAAGEPEPVPAAGEVAPTGFVWHDPATLSAHVPGGAAAITTHAGSVEFAAESAHAWLEQMTTYQPMWLAMRGRFTDEAQWLDLVRRATALLEAATSGGDGFAVHSPYVAVEIWPGEA